MSVTDLCKSGKYFPKFNIKHDLQVDISMINKQDKRHCIKVSTSYILKNNIFKISMLFNKT